MIFMNGMSEWCKCKSIFIVLPRLEPALPLLTTFRWMVHWIKSSADDILNYFSYFSRLQVSTFHANCLHEYNLHEMSNPVFLEKIKYNVSLVCSLQN